jgi:hypothetical protein
LDRPAGRGICSPLAGGCLLQFSSWRPASIQNPDPGRRLARIIDEGSRVPMGSPSVLYKTVIKLCSIQQLHHKVTR